ncbi:MAG: hypothetical protein HYX41_07745 [Bdellovibrio sp.]|nr:hypothetical protein [Bdellovibrio sp.]
MKKRTREILRYAFVLGIFAALTMIQANALNGVEAGSLMHQFIIAQKSEIKAFDHRKKFELKELKASQDRRLHEFEKTEKEARHKYFETHTKGEERRAYVQEFIKRRDAFRASLVDERTRKNSELETSLKSIKEDQAAKFKQFKTEVQKGDIPAKDLWPKAGI